MNKRIESYIAGLFRGVPMTRRAQELREELTANCMERYEDYLREGRSESEAFSLMAANVGDIDALLNDLKPDAPLRELIDYYRQRGARNTAVAVAMYILSPTVVILGSSFGLEQSAVVLMFLLIAGATGLLIYTHMSVPYDVAAYNRSLSGAPDPDEEDAWDHRIQNGATLRSIDSTIWAITTVVYFVWSFGTMHWHITWVAWLIGYALTRIAHLLFEMGRAQ